MANVTEPLVGAREFFTLIGFVYHNSTDAYRPVHSSHLPPSSSALRPPLCVGIKPCHKQNLFDLLTRETDSDAGSSQGKRYHQPQHLVLVGLHYSLCVCGGNDSEAESSLQVQEFRISSRIIENV
ncbi:hypothetical protein RRG08_017742 [Elysia crispata]|uniref:Uncharacterized protein n=1 Tax=Elysia crispata TaxID=231223 RepID=A0AAE0XRC7_9GAST|nr:hypothetical protein RRG08_017742 [Elysia crispata]